MKYEDYGTQLLRWQTISFSTILLIACLLISYFFPDAKFIRNQPYMSSKTGASFAKDTPLNDVLVEEYSVSLKSAASSYSKKKDKALILYRNPASRSAVEWFYVHVTENGEVARVILEYADKNDIPLSLAFALAYTESRFNFAAVNRNVNGTIDRGLFQLNNASFPRLVEADFFNPKTSAQYGLSHLRFCLATAGNEIAALAMYNAGTNRVKFDGTPRRTLNYISSIMNYRQALDELFAIEVAAFFEGSEKPMLTFAK
jgi:soluble lytic murein transglycosylase-like protein